MLHWLFRIVIHRQNDGWLAMSDSHNRRSSVIIELNKKEFGIMAVKYTEEQLNSIDKSLLITMFLDLQEPFETLSDKLATMDNRMQFRMRQLILSKQERFGRSSEKLTDHGQICFMEVDGGIIFFNEAEAVIDPDAPGPNDLEQPKAKGKKATDRKEEELSGLTTRVIPHNMTEQELVMEFGENGWKKLLDVVTKRYPFVPA